MSPATRNDDPVFDGARFRRLLTHRKWSNVDAAKYFGVKDVTIGRWCTGQSQPGGPSLIRIADWSRSSAHSWMRGPTNMLTDDTDACTVTRGGDA